MLKKIYIFLVIAGSLCPALPVCAQIAVCDKPILGQPCQIQSNSDDKTLTVIYRPNSNIEKKETLKSDNGSFEWIPEKEGVVALVSSTATKNVSVRYRDFSISGLLVLLIAATILFGGVVMSFKVLMRAQS